MHCWFNTAVLFLFVYNSFIILVYAYYIVAQGVEKLMKYFFGYVIDYERSVRFFTIHHYLYILFALLALMIPMRYANEQSRWFNGIKKYGVIGLFILFELIYHIQNMRFDAITLPLHLSSFSLILSLFLMVHPKNKVVFNFAFYVGVVAGFMALIFPFSYGFPYYNFRYYHFLFTHAFIIFVPVYVLKKERHLLSKSAYHHVFFYVIFMIPLMYILNHMFYLMRINLFYNYWFIHHVPSHVSPLFSTYRSYLFFLISGYYLVLSILYIVCKKNGITNLMSE